MNAMQRLIYAGFAAAALASASMPVFSSEVPAEFAAEYPARTADRVPDSNRR